MPGSPRSSTTEPDPARAAADGGAQLVELLVAPDERQATTSSPPGTGRSPPTAYACTGRALPFTMNGGSGSVANGLRASSSTPAVARICAGDAAAPSGAPRGSRCRPSRCRCGGSADRSRRRTPGRGSRRCGGADVQSRSTMRRKARSMRSSSWPAARGTPAARMILPPSRSMSVPRNVTSCSSATARGVDEQLVERVCQRVRTRRSASSSTPSKCTNATVATRCSGSSPPASRMVPQPSGQTETERRAEAGDGLRVLVPRAARRVSGAARPVPSRRRAPPDESARPSPG